MPGLIGLLTNKSDNAVFNLMLNKLNNYDYKIEKYERGGFHLGKVHLDYVNNTPQPIFSRDKRYALLMYGEIFSYDCIETDQIKDDGEFLLEKFLKNGVNCFIKINGQFVASIYDFI